MTEWKAPDSDVVVMTRIRLARNFADVPFDSVMSAEEAAHNISRADAAIQSAGQSDAFELNRLADMTESERGRLAEHYLISRGLLQRSARAAAFVSKGRTMSVMINEEDHVRIFGLLPGLQVERAADLAYRADGWLDQTGAYAFDRQFGFLTANPANAGTGMRATVLMHLPTMRAAGQIGRIHQEISKMGLALKPWHEENGDAIGNLYQLTGLALIGRTEEDMLSALGEAAAKIVMCERGVRGKLYEQDALLLEDRISRSLALIRSARLMSEREMMQRCSDLRMAAVLGLTPVSAEDIDRLEMDMQNASVDCQNHEKMTERQRDALRAQLLREAVGELIERAGQSG